jgi:C2H2-type zinc finger
MATVPNRKYTSREYRCSICGRTFDSIETLNSHKTVEHSHRSQAPAGVG